MRREELNALTERVIGYAIELISIATETQRVEQDEVSPSLCVSVPPWPNNPVYETSTTLLRYHRPLAPH